MRKQKMWRNVVYVGLAFAASFGCLQAWACEPAAIIQAYVAANYEQALKLNEHCIEDHKAALSTSSGTKRWVYEAMYSYQLAVGSQIAAEMGQFQAAEDMLSRARSYFRTTNPSSIAWTEIINLTEGFYLEKMGRTYDAEKLYEQNQDEHTLARLAVLAMHRGDKTAAVDWAARSLGRNPKNLTSQIVLASVSSPASLPSLRELSNSVPQESQSQPAYYAEVWWAALWIQETGRIGPFPVFD